METRANYVAIGAFVLIIIASAFGALYWLYRSSESGATAMLRIVFPEPVTGLSTGGSVLFNGIRVGEVTRLEFQPEGGDNVIAIARVDPSAPIKGNTVARLASQGITGVSYISLTGGTGDSLFAALPAGETPSLTAETSAFTNVLDNLQSVLSRLDTTLGDVNTLVTANRDNVGIVVTNVRTITDQLAAAAPQVPGLIGDVAGAARALGTATPQVASVVARVNGVLEAIDPARVASIVASADTFAATLPDIASQARTIVGTAGGVANRLDDAATRIGEAATGVRDAVAAVDRDAVNAVVADIRTATGVIASRSQAIGTLVDNAAAASGGLRAVAETLGSRTQAIAGAVDDASTLIGDARRAVAVATPAIEGVGRAIGAISPDRITGIVANVERVTGTLAGQADDVRALILSAREAATSINSVTALIAGRNEDIVRTLDNAAGLVTNLREASERAPQLVASATGLVDRLADTVRAVDTAALTGIVRDTARFATGLSAQTDEVGRVITGLAGTVARAEAIASAVAQRTPQLGTVIDNVAAVSTTARAVAARFPRLVDTLQPGIENASAALSAVDPVAVAGIVSDARAITSALGAQAGAVNRIVVGVDATVADARAISAGARTLTDDLVGRREAIVATLDDTRATAASVRRSADALPALVDTLRPGIDNVAAVLTAVDPAAISGIVGEARTLAASLGAQAPTVARIVASLDGTATRVEAVASALAQRTPQIGSVIDNVEAVSVSARTVADRLPALVDTLQPGVENVANVLSAIDRAAVGAIVADARTFAGSLAAQVPVVQQALASLGGFAGTIAGQGDDIEAFLRTANGTATRVEAVVSAIAQRTPQIGIAIDNFEAATVSARTAAARLPEFGATLSPAIENFANVLTAVDPAAVEGIVADARALTTSLNAQGAAVERIVADIGATAADVRAVTGDVRGRVPTLTAALDDARAAVADARTFAAELPALSKQLQPGIASLSDALKAVDPAAVQAIVANVRDVSATLAASRDDYAALVATAGEAARQVSAVTSAVADRANAIGGAIDDVSAFARELGQAAPDIDTVVAGVTDAATSVREAVAAVDADSVRAIVADIRSAAAAIGSRAGAIGGAIDNVVASARDLAEGLGSVGGEEGALKETIERARNIVANIETASNRIGPLVDRATSAFGDKLDVAYDGFNAATGAVERLAGAIAPRAGEITDGFARFSATGLDDLRALLTQGRSTLAAIESAVSSFDRNPSRVIFGGSDGPRYTPQRR